MILLYYFWFHQPCAPAMPKNQNQKICCAHAQIFYGAQSIRNAAETYNIFFTDFLVGSKYGKFTKKKLCNKISENPRKGFLQALDWGMNKIKKGIFFRNLHHSSFLLPSVMEFYYHPLRCFLCHSYVYIYIYRALLFETFICVQYLKISIKTSWN